MTSSIVALCKFTKYFSLSVLAFNSQVINLSASFSPFVIPTAFLSIFNVGLAIDLSLDSVLPVYSSLAVFLTSCCSSVGESVVE